jgi:hypothetical protein
MRMPSSLVLPIALLAFASISGSASAEDGVFADKIVFGQAAVFEGPAAALLRGAERIVATGNGAARTPASRWQTCGSLRARAGPTASRATSTSRSARCATRTTCSSTC